MKKLNFEKCDEVQNHIYKLKCYVLNNSKRGRVYFKRVFLVYSSFNETKLVVERKRRRNNKKLV